MKTDGYSIKDLEVLSGIKAHTIRIWEKRYSLLHPDRTDTNIRYYTDHDLKRILNVSLLVKNGFKISKVSKLDENEMKNSILELSETQNAESDYVDRFMRYMINFDHQSFVKLTNDLIGQFGFEESVSKVFFKLFERIGTFWQVGSLFPAQEHFVTNIFRQKMISEIDKIEITDKNAATILMYLPENELHETGLLFYSYQAKKYGYNVIYLGQYVPFNDLININKNVKVDYVFTAFVNSFPLEDLEKYLVDLKNVFQKQKIFITGYQLQVQTPAIPRNVKVIKDHREFKKYLA